MKDSLAPESSLQFAAPWGTMLHVISWTTTAVFLAVSLWIWFLLPRPAWQRGWIACLPLLILLTCGLFTVRGYRISRGHLLIRRLAWNTRIGLADLRAVNVFPGIMQSSIRLCGNGGLYGFTGWFRNPQLGVYKPYVTDLNRVVVLQFENRGPIVISPDEPVRFVNALRSHAPPVPGEAAARIHPVSPRDLPNSMK